jgi:hypothetical protein
MSFEMKWVIDRSNEAKCSANAVQIQDDERHRERI